MGCSCFLNEIAFESNEVLFLKSSYHMWNQQSNFCGPRSKNCIQSAHTTDIVVLLCCWGRSNLKFNLTAINPELYQGCCSCFLLLGAMGVPLLWRALIEKDPQCYQPIHCSTFCGVMIPEAWEITWLRSSWNCPSRPFVLPSELLRAPAWPEGTAVQIELCNHCSFGSDHLLQPDCDCVVSHITINKSLHFCWCSSDPFISERSITKCQGMINYWREKRLINVLREKNHRY